MASLHPRSRFIDDLVPLILESSDHWWPQDLLRLAQVSSAWLEPARRLLYASPSIHTFCACSQLARTLSDNPALLSFVKGLDLRPRTENTPEDALLIAKGRADLKFLFGLESLQFITLGGYLAVHAERFLNALADTESIKDLHIDGSSLAHSLSLRPSFEWGESIAFRFPNLKSLRFTDVELDITFPSIPYQLQLSDLVLDNVTIMGGYISHLLHETPSLQRLCVRSKTASEFDEHIKAVLASCAVRVLEYEVQTDLPSLVPLFEHDSPRLPSLRCLRLRGVQVDLEALTYIGEKCQNLEELVISGRMVAILPCDWVAFLQARALPLLRSIGLPWGTKHPPFKRWCGADVEKVLKAASLDTLTLVEKAEIRRG